MMALFRTIRAFFAVSGSAVIIYGLTLPTSGSQGRWLTCLAIGGMLIAVGLWPKAKSKDDIDNEPVVNVAAAIAFIFGLLTIQLGRLQIFGSKSLANQSGVDPFSGDMLSNPRSVNSALVIQRGSIRDRTGAVLAESIKSGKVYTRRYPVQTASYVCGYFSALKYGTAGIEKSFEKQLSGADLGSPIQTEVDRLLGRTPRGADLTLTIDAKLQQVAHEVMDGAVGAVVLIEVATGAVRALASNPHLDPNRLIAYDLDTATKATSYWEQLNDDPGQPLVVRSTDGLYTPGSTFKTVTASAAIDSGTASSTDVFTDSGQLEVDGHIIIEENRPDDSIDQWTLAEGLAFSLNVVFAQVGLELGGEKLRRYADGFGFGEDIPFDVPIAVGQISKSPDFLESAAALADTSFGQGELLTTPIGMALVAATLANGGELKRPYMVDRVTGPDGGLIESTTPRTIRRVVTRDTAAEMQAMMIDAVQNGYTTNAAIDGLMVGGKTGTAETGTDIPHSWFIGFAGRDEPEYAVAVVYEYGGVSSQGPIGTARQMLISALLSPIE